MQTVFNWIDQAQSAGEPKLPAIHTHDRIAYRRCRRKWSFTSPLRHGFTSVDEVYNKNLWFGSAWHFALEDYHGYRRWPSLEAALKSYILATPSTRRPPEWESLLALGQGMANYYTKYWLPRHNEFVTTWLDDEPMVEASFSLKIPGVEATLDGTFDRIAKDVHGRFYVVEYKTAQRIDTAKLDLDPQAGTYAWAAQQALGVPIEGVVYIQFRKAFPTAPRRLLSGGFSQDVRQSTCYELAVEALRNEFGTVPKGYQGFLNTLLDRETPNGNDYIRIDLVRRNTASANAELWKLQAEAREMLDQSLALYPNPTRDCAWDCAFKAACLAMDDGSDWRSILSEEFTTDRSQDDWRSRIRPPTDHSDMLPLELGG